MLTSVYGITLTLHTVCGGRTPFVALFYCPGAYSDYSSALSFTCVWYCAIVTAGMGYILLIQLLNISYNVTEREARLALRDNTGRRLLGGLVIDTGQYNRGFLCNWGHFLSLGSSSPQRSAEDIVWPPPLSADDVDWLSLAGEWPLLLWLPLPILFFMVGVWAVYPVTDNIRGFPRQNSSSRAASQQ